MDEKIFHMYSKNIFNSFPPVSWRLPSLFILYYYIYTLNKNVISTSIFLYVIDDEIVYGRSHAGVSQQKTTPNLSIHLNF